MPEDLECEILQKERYTNTHNLLFYCVSVSLVETVDCSRSTNVPITILRPLRGEDCMYSSQFVCLSCSINCDGIFVKF